MNITCVICSDLFTAGVDIYFTQCGHIFHFHCLINWLERSKSCPQCRNRVTEKTIHKVFFNCPPGEQTVDNTTLIYKLDELNLQILSRDKDIKRIKEKKSKLVDQNAKLREEVANLENNAKHMHSSMLAFKDQISYFKSKAKETDRLTEEILKLKNSIKNMENIEAVINGTRDQVNDILRNEHNVDSLALLAATLKKALLDSEKKVRDTDYNYKKLKNDLIKIKKQQSTLEAENADLRREVQQIKFKSERERNQFIQRLKNTGKNNIVVANPEAGSPQVASVSESDLSRLNKSHNESLKENDKTLNLSLSVNELKLQIVDSNSPYLHVKSNFGSFLGTIHDVPKNIGNKGLSIFKTNPSLEVVRKATKPKEVVYDGLGGSQKLDVYPTPKSKQGLKRNKSSGLISSSKFKKLTPSATKSNQQITDFINID